MDPIDWESIRDACKEILTLNRLDHPKHGVGLLIGHLDDKDIRAINDKENFYDTGSYNKMKKNFFLAYHQVQAHRRLLEKCTDEVAHFRRFQLWYSQQVAGGHVPGCTPGDNGFWAKENIRIVGEGGGDDSD